MALGHTSHPVAIILSFASNLQHELDVTIRLIQSNAAGFSFIFIGGLLSRAISSPMSAAEMAIPTCSTLIVGFLCNYIFDIANQASSPHEDYLNKPNRPIPAGLISIHQANVRWVLAWTLGPTIIYFFSGTWAILHLLHFKILIFVCYVWPRWNSWIMRNYFAAFSYFILARLLNQVLSKETPNWKISFFIDFIIFGWLMATVHIQEFYDIEGDRKSGRTTLPMLLSEKGLKLLRVGASLFIITFGLGISFFARKEMTRNHLGAPIHIMQQISSCVLAYRISASNSTKMDKTTYQVYYYPCVLLTLLSLVLIMR
ncbi:UbiA prenyltransferase family domain-containing protein [Trichoderma chlorosporum]